MTYEGRSVWAYRRLKGCGAVRWESLDHPQTWHCCSVAGWSSSKFYCTWTGNDSCLLELLWELNGVTRFSTCPANDANGPECPCLPKFMCWTPNPNVMVLVGAPVGDQVTDVALKEGLLPLKNRHKNLLSFCPSHVGVHEKSATSRQVLTAPLRPRSQDLQPPEQWRKCICSLSGRH